MEDPNRLAAGMHAQLKLTSGYIANTVRPRLVGILNPDFREQLIIAAFLRAHCWMSSLERLDNVRDFQAIATSTRALLEICVDVILLTHGDNDLAEKARDWTVSVKFKSCEQLVQFFQKKNRPIPAESAPLEVFYRTNGTKCAALRARHWNGRHPERWTSKTLLLDCAVADNLEPHTVPIELKMGLEEFYESQIRRINWTIHGSGYAAILLNPRSFTLTCGLGYKWSTDLSILIAELTMRAMKLTDAVENIRAEWKALKMERYEAMWTQFSREMNAGEENPQ